MFFCFFHLIITSKISCWYLALSIVKLLRGWNEKAAVGATELLTWQGSEHPQRTCITHVEESKTRKQPKTEDFLKSPDFLMNL